ncbi:hypothetical protein C0584_06060 [Candidatus Parcubacteria bacterium]|nr:MAG: hypothetical protein C0584_06060 [Candidatus Parcubacteria bacterium]
MINPNLLIAIEHNDIDTQVQMAKLLYGENISVKKLNEILVEMQLIISIFEAVGPNYDLKKVEHIVEVMKESYVETDEIWKRYYDNSLFDNLAYAKLDELNYLCFLINCIVDKHLGIIKKKIGRKDFNLIFDENHPRMDPELVRSAFKNQHMLDNGEEISVQVWQE